MDRRQFVISSAALGGASMFGLPRRASAAAAATAVEAAKQ